MPNSIRRDLQGVRAVAVLGVVIYHLRPSWLPGGFAGVDVFFVLSGFFITGLLLREADENRTIDLRQFWGRRARRLLPASLLVLVATVLLGLVLTNPLESRRIARDGLYAAVFGINWHEAASGLAYGQDPDPSPLQHYWSLGVEEQFYLAWPLVILALAVLWRRVPSLPPRRTIVVVALPAGVLSFALAFHQTVGNQPYAYYGTFGRVWQLALGGLLAAAATRLAAAPQQLRRHARYLGFAAVLTYYLAAPPVSAYPRWWSLAPTLGAALLVAAGPPAGRPDPIARLLASRPGQLGGRYSYSWYLWHWAPLVVLPIAIDRPLRGSELVACALASLLVAVLTFHLLEDPIRRNRWLAHRNHARSVQLGIALMILGVGVSAWTSSAAENAAAGAHVVTTTHRSLRPQPAEAATEQTIVARDGCQLSISSSALAPDCRYLGDSGHGDVVLVGDSHASMWFPAVRRSAVRQHWGLRVWARTSCPFADVQKSVSAGNEYHHCDRWRADVIERLIAERPSLVIVTSYAQSGLHVNDPRTGAAASQARAHELFQTGLERNLSRLRAAGLHVLLVHDVPAYERAAPDCALTHPDDLDTCSLPEDDAIPYGGVDLRAARAVPGVDVADFTDDFCRAGRCHQIVDDILAYRDVNHLTAEMALHLAPQLESAARAALR